MLFNRRKRASTNTVSTNKKQPNAFKDSANVPVKKRIAIIGSGVSGLTCAHYLIAEHDVTIFEANDYIGGHINTIDVTLQDGKKAKNSKVENSAIDTVILSITVTRSTHYYRSAKMSSILSFGSLSKISYSLISISSSCVKIMMRRAHRGKMSAALLRKHWAII